MFLNKSYNTNQKMGLYPEYGVEYAMIMNDGSIGVIYPVRNFDERLLKSNYYIEREKFYHKNHCKVWREKIDNNNNNNNNLDIEVTRDEKKHIDDILEKNKDKIKEHGFYDAGYVESTLDFII